MVKVGFSSDEKTYEDENVFSVSRYFCTSVSPRIGVFTFLTGSFEWLFKERGFVVRRTLFLARDCTSFVVVAW